LVEAIGEGGGGAAGAVWTGVEVTGVELTGVEGWLTGTLLVVVDVVLGALGVTATVELAEAWRTA
jgi:hypothetical protein